MRTPANAHLKRTPSGRRRCVSEHRESEAELVGRAQAALSNCSWTVGECAAHWTKRYAKGRTDADFGILIGLSGDQVYQRRRVAETFSDVKEEYKHLKWSHFYTALTWDDASECLRWADDMQATIAEMRAWRRAQRGEDLTEAGDDDVVRKLRADLGDRATEAEIRARLHQAMAEIQDAMLRDAG